MSPLEDSEPRNAFLQRLRSPEAREGLRRSIPMALWFEGTIETGLTASGLMLPLDDNVEYDV